MSRDRGLSRGSDQGAQSAGRIEDAGGRRANGGTTTIVAIGDPCRISRLVKLPQRPDARMHALRAPEEFAADSGVVDRALLKNRARDRNRPLGVIRRLTDSPLAFAVASIPGDDGARLPLESPDAVRVPPLDACARQAFGLFTDGVAGRHSFEAAEYPLAQINRGSCARR